MQNAVLDPDVKQRGPSHGVTFSLRARVQTENPLMTRRTLRNAEHRRLQQANFFNW